MRVSSACPIACRDDVYCRAENATDTNGADIWKLKENNIILYHCCCMLFSKSDAYFQLNRIPKNDSFISSIAHVKATYESPPSVDMLGMITMCLNDAQLGAHADKHPVLIK